MAKNVDPAKSAKASERMRHQRAAITVLAIGRSIPEVAFGLAAARTRRVNGRDASRPDPSTPQTP